MKTHSTPIEGLFVVESEPVSDARGRFSRIFCEAELAVAAPGLKVKQANLARTARRGAIRGMHYQTAPFAETKLVRCLRGRVFDVAVDLRHGSPTFCQWHGVELSDTNDLALLIPEGCAHGFQSLDDDVELLYFHSAPWSRAHEGGVRHDDPSLAIAWPLPAVELSERDRTFAAIAADFQGIFT